MFFRLCQPQHRFSVGYCISSLLCCCLSPSQPVKSLHSFHRSQLALACLWTLEVAKEIFGVFLCWLFTNGQGFGSLMSLKGFFTAFFLSFDLCSSSSQKERIAYGIPLDPAFTASFAVIDLTVSTSDWLSSFPAQLIVSFQPSSHVLQLRSSSQISAADWDEISSSMESPLS